MAVSSLHRPHGHPRLAVVAVFLLAALALLGARAAPALATPTTTTPSASAGPGTGPETSRGPLLWTAPTNVSPSPIDAVACPSSALCVAVDRGGHVLWSTTPENPRSGWQIATVDNNNDLTSLACPSTTLCVAVDSAGNAVTSTDPTGGSGAWTSARIDTARTQNASDNAGGVLLRGVSCPTTTLCVAVDAVGDALVSTNPTGGAGGWVSAHVDDNTTFACTPAASTPDPTLSCQPPLVGVSCPDVNDCAAVDFAGNILTTTNPLAATWTSTPAPGRGYHSLWAVSCAAARLCLTVDGPGDDVISFDPTLPARQQVRRLPASLTNVFCSPAALCFVAGLNSSGISELLASAQPAAARPAYTSTSLGDVNGVACTTLSLCLAVDDEGEVSAGVRTTTANLLLREAFFPRGRLPTIAALDRRPVTRFSLASPIPARLTLTWTLAGAVSAGAPVLARLVHSFVAPGAVRLAMPLDGYARSLFRSLTGPVHIHALASYTTATGSVVVQRTLTFRSPPHRRRSRPRH
ncbi:MAG TPA: hypothetical protein VFN48_00610 [Solirubrobacteraceae bacterium]|nr:hypothetical protein [Solirubrobacteraceae bacterium]